MNGSPPANDCPACREDWEHCHAVLIAHADGTYECVRGPDCPATPDLHDLQEVCAELRPACGCAAPGETDAPL